MKSKVIYSILSLLIILYAVTFYTFRTHIEKVNDFGTITPFENEIIDTINKQVVVFFGNSIFDQYDLDKYYNQSYINRGISGNTTAALLFRIDEVIEINPQKIILLIGVNDISRGISIDSLITNYSQILSKFRNEIPNCNVSLVSILPVRNTYSFERLVINTGYWLSFIRPFNINNSILQANNRIIKLAKEFNHKFINVNNDFLGIEGIYLDSKFATDNVHLNDEGYKLLTLRIKESGINLN